MTHPAAPLTQAATSETLLKIPTAVLEFMGLPSLHEVTEEQSRGVACVWCRARINTETAIDLGEQKSPPNGSTSMTGMTWFPRACRPCTADRAHRGLFEHAPMCEQCVDEPGGCEINRVLYRLVREGRR
ncbi:hypothetical protein [Streptomyces thermoviolaceus]|jgi:hypothetical protein|uniref:hypothetical protein n=1 Tax=Streptomyces thermoviolaceus TaxID=1952 RepID=UPI0019B75C96|nr:hypothetical protein [Streptomyces thermoviolaceus]GGV80537.1 hypothetical protein GCM10010499_43670 [Streptomyces thermoviolaceus subsp. apingens]